MDCASKLKFVGALLLPNVGGYINGKITRVEIETWYRHLKKPSFNPPNWIFAPVWISLYTGMGYASYLIIRDKGITVENQLPMALYGGQLALNMAWTPLFFKNHNLKWSLIDICLLTGTATACGLSFYHLNRTAGLIFIPYVAWLSFATILNWSIWRLNPEEQKPQIKESKEN